MVHWPQQPQGGLRGAAVPTGKSWHELAAILEQAARLQDLCVQRSMLQVAADRASTSFTKHNRGAQQLVHWLKPRNR